MSGNVVNATRTTEANAEVAPPSVTATESHDSSLQEGQETSHPLLTALGYGPDSTQSAVTAVPSTRLTRSGLPYGVGTHTGVPSDLPPTSRVPMTPAASTGPNASTGSVSILGRAVSTIVNLFSPPSGSTTAPIEEEPSEDVRQNLTASLDSASVSDASSVTSGATAVVTRLPAAGSSLHHGMPVQSGVSLNPTLPYLHAPVVSPNPSMTSSLQDRLNRRIMADPPRLPSLEGYSLVGASPLRHDSHSRLSGTHLVSQAIPALPEVPPFYVELTQPASDELARGVRQSLSKAMKPRPEEKMSDTQLKKNSFVLMFMLRIQAFCTLIGLFPGEVFTLWEDQRELLEYLHKSFSVLFYLVLTHFFDDSLAHLFVQVGSSQDGSSVWLSFLDQVKSRENSGMNISNAMNLLHDLQFRLDSRKDYSTAIRKFLTTFRQRLNDYTLTSRSILPPEYIYTLLLNKLSRSGGEEFRKYVLDEISKSYRGQEHLLTDRDIITRVDSFVQYNAFITHSASSDSIPQSSRQQHSSDRSGSHHPHHGKARVASSSSTKIPSSQVEICHYCGVAGHISPECPDKRKGIKYKCTHCDGNHKSSACIKKKNVKSRRVSLHLVQDPISSISDSSVKLFTSNWSDVYSNVMTELLHKVELKFLGAVRFRFLLVRAELKQYFVLKLRQYQKDLYRSLGDGTTTFWDVEQCEEPYHFPARVVSVQVKPPSASLCPPSVSTESVSTDNSSNNVNISFQITVSHPSTSGILPTVSNVLPTTVVPLVTPVSRPVDVSSAPSKVFYSKPPRPTTSGKGGSSKRKGVFRKGSVSLLPDDIRSGARSVSSSSVSGTVPGHVLTPTSLSGPSTSKSDSTVSTVSGTSTTEKIGGYTYVPCSSPTPLIHGSTSYPAVPLSNAVPLPFPLGKPVAKLAANLFKMLQGGHPLASNFTQWDIDILTDYLNSLRLYITKKEIANGTELGIDLVKLMPQIANELYLLRRSIPRETVTNVKYGLDEEYIPLLHKMQQEWTLRVSKLTSLLKEMENPRYSYDTLLIQMIRFELQAWTCPGYLFTEYSDTFIRILTPTDRYHYVTDDHIRFGRGFFKSWYSPVVYLRISEAGVLGLYYRPIDDGYIAELPSSQRLMHLRTSKTKHLVFGTDVLGCHKFFETELSPRRYEIVATIDPVLEIAILDEYHREVKQDLERTKLQQTPVQRLKPTVKSATKEKRHTFIKSSRSKPSCGTSVSKMDSDLIPLSPSVSDSKSESVFLPLDSNAVIQECCKEFPNSVNSQPLFTMPCALESQILSNSIPNSMTSPDSGTDSSSDDNSLADWIRNRKRSSTMTGCEKCHSAPCICDLIGSVSSTHAHARMVSKNDSKRNKKLSLDTASGLTAVLDSGTDYQINHTTDVEFDEDSFFFADSTNVPSSEPPIDSTITTVGYGGESSITESEKSKSSSPSPKSSRKGRKSKSSSTTESTSQESSEIENVHALLASSILVQEDPTEYKDPKNWKEAISRPPLEAASWEKATDEEWIGNLLEEVIEIVDESEAIGNETLGTTIAFKKKPATNGNPARFKVRICARGDNENKALAGILYAPTSSSTIFRSIISIFTSTAFQSSAPDIVCRVGDVSNAFCHAELPPGRKLFVRPPIWKYRIPGKAFKLKRALYGLVESPNLWYNKFKEILTSLKLIQSEFENCLYYKFNSSGSLMCAIIVFVDDLLYIGPLTEWNVIVAGISAVVKFKDMGQPDTFLGMELTFTNEGVYISQQNYLNKLFERYFKGKKLNATRTPMPTFREQSRLPMPEQRNPDPSQYQSLVGSINYAAVNTRLDISKTLNEVSKFLLSHGVEHFDAVKRVFRYLYGTSDLGLFSSYHHDMTVTGYTDANWETRTVTGIVIMVDTMPIAFSSKDQKSISLSTMEAELFGASQAARILSYISDIFKELHVLGPSYCISLKCDAQSAIDLINNSASVIPARHMNIRLHYLREKIARGVIRLVKVTSEDNLADLFTKPLPIDRHAMLVSRMMYKVPNAANAVDRGVLL